MDLHYSIQAYFINNISLTNISALEVLQKGFGKYIYGNNAVQKSQLIPCRTAFMFYILEFPLNKQMNFSSFALTFLLGLLGARCQVYSSDQYDLGDNLLYNPDFLLPDMGTKVWKMVHGVEMPGWTCTPKCQMINNRKACNMYSTPSCEVSWWQGLQTNTDGAFDKISQNIRVKEEGKYLIQYDWIKQSANDDNLETRVNGSAVDNLSTTGPANFLFQTRELVIDLPVGVTELSFQQVGTPIGTNSLTFSKVKVRQLIKINQAQALVFQAIMNMTSMANSIPGGRVVFPFLLNFMSIFDRLQFYFFHEQNLTYYSKKMLCTANDMAEQRGKMTQNIFQSCNNSFCNAYNQAYNGTINALDKQKNYTSANFLQKNEKGIGFFANNLEFFFYELPSSILIHVLFALTFRTLFNYRISKFFRKYAFYGTLCLILFEGNVEQFSFYFFSECRLLYSATVAHKVGRYFMLLFFFFLMFFSVSGITLFFVHYKKLAKYFMEDCRKVSLMNILFETLEKLVFPLLFGAVHALFMDNLLIQTAVLFAIESGYLAVKIYALWSGVYQMRTKVVLLSLTSMLRIVFMVSSYLYEKLGQPVVINLIHRDVFWLYLIIWAVELIYDVSFLLSDLVKFVMKTFSPQANEKGNNSKRRKVSSKGKMVKAEVEQESKEEVINRSILAYRQGTSEKDKKREFDKSLNEQIQPKKVCFQKNIFERSLEVIEDVTEPPTPAQVKPELEIQLFD